MNGNDLSSFSETDWTRADRLQEDEIDTSEIPPLDDPFFTSAKLWLPKGKRVSHDEL